MMRFINKGILLLVLIMGSVFGQLYAQRTLIDVKADSTAILIGEQTVLHLTVTTDNGRDVKILVPRDTLMAGVEVLALSRPDSTVIENNRLIIEHDVLVTSFDSALYLLPPFHVIDGLDTISSNQIALKVSTIPVNVDNPEEFFDIKETWSPPFVLADYYTLIFGILLALFLICVLGYIIQRMRKRKSTAISDTPELKLPPHEVALIELNSIKQQKLWQQGRNKEYYTQLTDTIRKYLVRRFGVDAMEMTSGEILDIMKHVSEADSAYNNLEQVLHLSDLVKFAKFKPLPDENDLSLVNSYLFVNQTKVEEISAVEKEDENMGTEGSTIIKG